MLRIFADWETFYSKEYTLQKMSPLEYVLDNRFQMLGCGIAIEHDVPFFLPREESIDFFRSIKEPYAMISHNALFDACILAFRYNIHPDALFCTMNMARAMLMHKLPQGRVSLKNVMSTMGIGEKGDTVETQMKGMRYEDIPPHIMVELVGYTLNDVNGCRDIFFNLRDGLSAQEAFIMDRVIRMTTQPKLYANMDKIAAYHAEVVAEKKVVLARVSADRSALMSNPKFAELLKSYGVDPPTKISPITGKETFAFAKNDSDFTDLLAHDDPAVQALVGARLGIKSTIEETRAQRFWNIALATQNTFMQPLFPCPLKYSGAHTHRLSGDWKLNVQNLGSRKGTRLRECLEAPMDHVILAVDASQIEARLVAWLAQQENLLSLFASKTDPYAAFMSKVLNRPITKRDNPVERFNGKTCVLGLGFGMGEAKLYDKLTFDAHEEGYDVEYNHNDVGGYVQAYRQEYSNIKRLWYWCDGILWDMVNGDTLKSSYNKRIGPCRIESTTVILPSGLKLYYEGLVREQDEFWFTYGGRRKKIYGGKMTENVVQALDRQHTFEAAVRTELRAKQEGIDGRITHQVHDENLYVVLRSEWRRLAQIAIEEMRRPCAWAIPENSEMRIGLPLDAEVKMGMNYGSLQEIKM